MIDTYSNYLTRRAGLLESEQLALTRRPWLTSTMRVLRGWGVPTDDGEVPSREFPPELAEAKSSRLDDNEAKANRFHHYARVRDPHEAKTLLQHGLPIQATFRINEDWFDARHGLIDLTASPVLGSHTVHLLQHKPKLDRYVFWNPVGPHWGHEGHGSLTSDYFTKNFVEGWVGVGTGETPEHALQDEPGTVLWEAVGVFGEETYGRDIYDPVHDDRMAWAFAVRNGEFLDVDELFVKPEYRRRGHGKFLASLMRQTANELGLNLRLWIPHVDVHETNLPGVAAIVASVGLRLFTSGNTWAAYRATKHERLSTIYLPGDDWSTASKEIPPLAYSAPAPHTYPEMEIDPVSVADSDSTDSYQKSIDLILGRGDPI